MKIPKKYYSYIRVKKSNPVCDYTIPLTIRSKTKNLNRMTTSKITEAKFLVSFVFKNILNNICFSLITPLYKSENYFTVK